MTLPIKATCDPYEYYAILFIINVALIIPSDNGEQNKNSGLSIKNISALDRG
jgi:hypothetical protein